MTGELNNDFIKKYLRKDDDSGEEFKEAEAADGRNKIPRKSTSITSLLLKQNLINRIGDISEYPQIRKLSISFNNIMGGLHNLDQLPNLRHLSAYCCGLKQFEDLADNRRLEKLHLQQNCISEIPYCMRQLQKIRHLRLDRNQIKQLEHLKGCTALRTLNLSSNCLESLDGIAGLHSLVELKANNNSLTSLKSLRALPALREVHVDGNLLKNLDGIQHVPTLQVLYCNNNQINAFKIPQTYTHVGSLDKGAPKNASSSTTASGNISTSDKSKTSNTRAENTKLGLFNMNSGIVFVCTVWLGYIILPKQDM